MWENPYGVLVNKYKILIGEYFRLMNFRNMSVLPFFPMKMLDKRVSAIVCIGSPQRCVNRITTPRHASRSDTGYGLHNWLDMIQTVVPTQYAYNVYIHILSAHSHHFTFWSGLYIKRLCRFDKYFNIIYSLIRLAVLNFGGENDSDQYKHQPRIHFIKSMSREVRSLWRDITCIIYTMDLTN